MALTGYLAGLWSDTLIRNGTSITLTRKIMQVRFKENDAVDFKNWVSHNMFHCVFCSFSFGCHLLVFIWFWLLFCSVSTQSVSYLQSIGFVGPAVALVGLTAAKTPSTASAWLSLAVGLKAFSHCGFLVNLQVRLLSNREMLNNMIECLFSPFLTVSLLFPLPGDCSTLFWCFTRYDILLASSVIFV